MKRLVASLLSLALVLGASPLPAAAQVLSAPSAGLSAPVAPAIPAASVLAPALAAPAPALLAAPLAPAPLAAPAPAAAPAAAALPIQAAPVAASARAAAQPARDASAVNDALFDGTKASSALDASIPAAADAPLSSFDRPSRLYRAEEPRRPDPPKPPKAPATKLSTFAKGLFLGAAAAATAPVLWEATPGMKLAYLGGTALVASLLILDAVWMVRLVSRAVRLRPVAAPSRRARWTSAAIGIAMGVMVGAAPTVYEGPMLERFSSWMDASRPAAEQEHLRAVPGRAMADETIKVLSANPVGKQVLERLRDRGGVIRLPTFFISNQPDSYANHTDAFGSLALSASEVTSRGWTIDQFLADPALQRRLVREMASTIAHELTHEDQGRVSPLSREFWAQFAMEDEYEAFLVQHAYVHAELKANPSAELRDVDLSRYRAALADVDGWLKGLDASYPKNKLQNLPRWRAFRAELDRGWAAHRVEGYLLLARRDAASAPQLAKIDLAKAKEAAQKAGLPAPKLPKGK